MSTDHNKTIVIDSADGIMHFHMLAQKHAMRMEIAGFRMKGGRSICAHVKRTYGLKSRLRKDLLAEFTELINETYPTKMPVVPRELL